MDDGHTNRSVGCGSANSSLPAEEGGITQRQARGISFTPARQATGSAARGVQTGDRLTVAIQHLARGAGRQTTQSKGMTLEIALTITQRGEGRLDQRAQPLGVLVEIRVLAPLRQLVDLPRRVHPRPGGLPQLLFHFLPALPDGGHRDVRLDDRAPEGLIVDQQPRAGIGLAQHMVGHPPMVAVLIDKSLASLIDKDTEDQRSRWKERYRGEELLHVQGSGAHPHTHTDASPLVISGADLLLTRLRGRDEALNHRTVADEAPGAQNHPTAGPDKTGFARLTGYDADDPPLIVDNQRQRAAVITHLHAQFLGAGAQHLHHHLAATPADKLYRVPARRRFGLPYIRPGLLVARPKEGVIGGRFDPFARQVRSLERHALLAQPVEVRGGPLGILGHAVRVSCRPAGDHQIFMQILGGILETVLALHVSSAAAAHVHLSSGEAGTAAAHACHFQHHHPGTRLARLDGRAGAGCTKADHHHVGLQVPCAHCACGTGLRRRIRLVSPHNMLLLCCFHGFHPAAGRRLSATSPSPLKTQLVPPSEYIMVTQRLQAVQPLRRLWPWRRLLTQAGSWISTRPSARLSKPSAMTRSTPSADATPPR